MIFSSPLFDLVLAGRKTQTRRTLVEGKACRYKVGRTYPVQRTRTSKSSGRILILATHEERLRQITDDDAIAEGFSSRAEFLTYVSRLWKTKLDTPEQRRAFLATRVWVITFRTVEGESA